jgi:hypothetical protein
MKIRLLFLIIFSVAGSYAATPIKELAIKLMKSSELERQASKIVTTEQRAELVPFLRNARDKHSYFGGGCIPEILLINLNDTEQIKMQLEKVASDHPVVASRGMILLGLSSQISVIPSLAEYVYDEEPNIMPIHGDQWLMARSIDCAQTMLSILSRSPDVSEEVQQWAKENNRGFTPKAVHCRTVVRKWWPQNKAFFESGEYEKIRPLMDEAIPAPQKAPVAEDLDVKMPDSENTTTDSVAPDEPNERSFSWASVILGGISVVLLAGLFLRQTRT